MPRKPKSRERMKGPFRGPTPLKVFQTVDVGSGDGRRIKSIAKKFPKRKYVALDSDFHQNDVWDAHEQTRSTMEKLTTAGVVVREQKLKNFINRMIKRRLKTRYVNVDMPGWLQEKGNWKDRYGFRKLFANAPLILLPNGKIFIKTENPEFAEWLKSMAQEAGLKSRPLLEISSSKLEISKQRRPVSLDTDLIPTDIFAPIKQLSRQKIEVIGQKVKARNKMKMAQWPSFGGHPVTHYMHDKYHFFILEITLGLKKAILDKAKRRNWPR